jgi:hypothetical protein
MKMVNAHSYVRRHLLEHGNFFRSFDESADLRDLAGDLLSTGRMIGLAAFTWSKSTLFGLAASSVEADILRPS